VIKDLIAPLDALVKAAGDAILEVYNQVGELNVDAKQDNSPLTEADRRAHQILVEGLTKLTPQWPVLSEESVLPEFAERKQWGTYWLVDPLDGTKEFIGRNGEFTVNVALIRDGEPVAGWVWVPVMNVLYRGICLDAQKEAVVVRDGQLSAMKTRAVSVSSLAMVASRRHGGEALEGLLKKIEGKFGAIQMKSMGSSLKICMVAEGEADWYPRLAPTSEWDTAAAHAVLRGAGGDIMNLQLQPLRYNQKSDILNPHFHALGDLNYGWSTLISQ
jgi:3'(2'), 5'-bisphosphate nucleotidase